MSEEVNAYATSARQDGEPAALSDEELELWLTPEGERALRESGVAWCSEEWYERIWKVIDDLRSALAAREAEVRALREKLRTVMYAMQSDAAVQRDRGTKQIEWADLLDGAVRNIKALLAAEAGEEARE